MTKTPVKQQVQVNFRMPEDLRDRIKAKAEKNGTSMNGEIVDALEKAFPRPQTAMAVVEDVALGLGFVDEPLRSEAIALLVKLAETNRLSRLADGLAIQFKHSED